MKKRRKALYLGLGLLISAGVFLIIMLFPRMLNHKQLVSIQYTTIHKTPYLITLWQETGSSENTGTYLNGYEVRLIEPGINTVKSKLFVKRYDEDIPPAPQLIAHPDGGKLWLVQPRQFIQGDTGFVKALQVSDDGKLSLFPGSPWPGYVVTHIYQNRVQLVNRYNEEFCMDLSGNDPKPGSCYELSYDQKQNVLYRFFLVKHTAASSRCHLFFYDSDSAAPPPEIRVGTTSGDVPFEGTPIPEDLDMQYGTVTQERLEYYRAHLHSWERMQPVYEKEYLYSPSVLYSDSTKAIILSADSLNTSMRFDCITRDGKPEWSVTPANLKRNIYGVQCLYTAEKTILIDPQNWAIAIDNKTGKIAWEYIP